MQTRISGCAICGRQRISESGWFLLTESRWQDKVTILQWHDQLASQTGVQRVCGASHAQELVVHWMTTGDLDYPFARTKPSSLRDRARVPSGAREIDTRGVCRIGELAIHRESIHRILRESPHSLTAILDALLSALERNRPTVEAPVEVEFGELCEVGPGVH